MNTGTERPIIMTAESVRAILAGRKTQTRKIIPGSPVNQTEAMATSCPYGAAGNELLVIELRSIPGVDAKYAAGSDGLVYSWSNANTNARKEKPFALQASHGSTGYPLVSLTGTRRGSAAVHSIVCAAFHGEAPSEASEVRHLDGDKTNNKPDNLRWGSRAENEADKRRHQTLACGSRHGAARLTDDDVALIRSTVGIGLVTSTRAAEFYGVLPSTILDIVGGRTWRGCGLAEPELLSGYADIHLCVESIAIHRLQEISGRDVLAEGIDNGKSNPTQGVRWENMQCMAFGERWDAINGKRASWAANPFVWAITFRRMP